MFIKGRIYRHKNPHCSLDMRVLFIKKVDSKGTRMKVEFLHQWNGETQYTGRGVTGYTDEVIVDAELYKDWENLGPSKEYIYDKKLAED